VESVREELLSGRVCKIGDPSWVAESAGQTRERGGRIHLKVRRNGAVEYVPVDQLQPADEASGDHPIDRLEEGRFAAVAEVRRALTRVRLSGRLLDVLYSVDAANCDFYAYQYKPVLGLIESPTQSILVADEVGLGKTIEAGLAWTELRARQDARRLLVLCPAALREKWRLELGRRFGVDAEVADARRVLECLSTPHLQGRGFALVASLQGLRPTREGGEDGTDDPRQRLAALLADRDDDGFLLDLLVVDEAHHLRNRETMTHRLAASLRPAAEHALFLSATPIHNRNDDLLALLGLIDPDSFGEPEVFRAVLEANRPLVEARERLLRGPSLAADEVAELLARAAGHPLLAGSAQLARVRRAVEEQPELTRETRVELAAEVARVNLLAASVTRTRKRDVQRDRVLREPVPERVRMDAEEREVYQRVTQIVSDYASRRDVSEAFLLATPQRQMTSSIAAAVAHWRQRGAELEAEDEDWDEAPDGARWAALGPLQALLARAATGLDPARLGAVDTKYGRLARIMRGFRAEHGAEKVVLFTGFKTTLRYLAQRLVADGFAVMTMSGDSTESKQAVIDRFAAAPGGTALLTTEVGSEGVDLQFCRFLVNYDLPWNPMRLEQRTGRLDRLGQAAPKITIWNLMHEGTINERIYTRLVEKLDLCREALGDFEALLGDQLRALTRDILRGRLTAGELDARLDQTASALETLRRQEAELEEDAGGLAIQEQVLQRIEAQRRGDGWIGPADLRHYVLDFLEACYPRCRVAERDAETVELLPDPDLQLDLRSFMTEQRIVEPTRLASSDGRPVVCRFVNRVREERGRGPELLSTFHPLVRMIRWRLRDQPRSRLVAAVRLARDLAPEAATPGLYIVASSLWRVDGVRPHERLAFAGTLPDGTLIPADAAEHVMLRAVQHGAAWSDAARELDLPAIAAMADGRALSELERRFDEFAARLLDEADDRIRLLTERIERRLARQRETARRTLATLGGRHEALHRAAEGKLRRAEARAERDRALVARQRDLRPDQQIVAVAVVRVE
jgi:superfamily II DNA or RNA helicase